MIYGYLKNRSGFASNCFLNFIYILSAPKALSCSYSSPSLSFALLFSASFNETEEQSSQILLQFYLSFLLKSPFPSIYRNKAVLQKKIIYKNFSI
jgi:hypothetical protein